MALRMLHENLVLVLCFHVLFSSVLLHELLCLLLWGFMMVLRGVVPSVIKFISWIHSLLCALSSTRANISGGVLNSLLLFVCTLLPITFLKKFPSLICVSCLHHGDRFYFLCILRNILGAGQVPQSVGVLSPYATLRVPSPGRAHARINQRPHK